MNSNRVSRRSQDCCGSSQPHLHNNDVREECICVPKVYDWVVFPNDMRHRALLPDPCRANVEALLESNIPLRVEVIQPLIPPRFPISCGQVPPTDQKVSCSILPPIRRIQIPSPLNGQTIDVALVRFLFILSMEIVITREDTSAEVCRFLAPVQLDEEVVLCLPLPLNESNISCRLIELEVTPTNLIFDGMVELDVRICTDIQVEADVKLEVLARFCHPRPPIEVPKQRHLCPPQITFPPQCPDLFPRPDCDCQGAVRSTNEDITAQLPGLTIGTGTACINAEICDNCNPASTNLLFRFSDLETDPALARTFVFESHLLDSMKCLTTLPDITSFITTLGLPAPLLALLPELNAGSLAVAATGRGVASPECGANAPLLAYNLLLIENAQVSLPGPLPLRDVYVLTIDDNLNPFFAAVVPVHDVNLRVRVCRQFPS